MKSGKPQISISYPNKIKWYALRIQWRKLLDEYIERFGFSENFLEIVRKQKEILQFKVKRIVESDRSVNAFIKISEQELSELQKDDKGGDFWQLKGTLDKAGFNIRPMETSVSEFYTHVKTLMNQNKRTSNAE